MSGLSPSIRPTALRREGDEFLVIEWSDGKVGKIAWRTLREQCPCAGCREEREQPPDPFRILSPAELQPLRPVNITPIGYYAYKITWSDGHDAGLYTLEHLRYLGQRENEEKGP
jgi:DUF971 family protein